jgi:putative ABC transport system substrate-binding protein
MIEMDRRVGRQTVLAALLVAGLLLAGCASHTQAQKVYHVGIISGAEPFATIADSFKTRMTELGYIEGKNIVYDLQKLNADPQGEKRAAQRFVEGKVDMIFAFPTDPALAAKAATQGTDIPVVFALGTLEETGLVESVRQPGGHITGVRYPLLEDTVKRLEILHELVPQAKRILIVYDIHYPTAPSALAQLRPAASSLGLRLVEDPVGNLEEIRGSLEDRAASEDIGIDAILIMPEILTQSPDGFALITKFAAEHRLPVGGALAHTADLGAVFSYISDNAQQGMLAANLADKIFRGAPAGTLPVATADSRLRLNYRTAKSLGLNVSEGLLARADEIIR